MAGKKGQSGPVENNRIGTAERILAEVISSDVAPIGHIQPVDATREAIHCARKTIGPIKDSAIEWVSFESIEIVMALGSSSGNLPNIFA
jgi:hypothetical protein